MAQTTKNIKAIINGYKKQLKSMNINCKLILIYGSYARGEAKEGSDIDLIVISEDWRKYNTLKRLEILGLAAARILKPVQAVGFTPQEISNKKIFPVWLEIIKHAKKAA